MADLTFSISESITLTQGDIAWLRNYLIRQRDQGPKPGDANFCGGDVYKLTSIIPKISRMWKIAGGDLTQDQIVESIVHG